jgi:hypothetical protein
MFMKNNLSHFIVLSAIAVLAACGGGSTSQDSTSQDTLTPAQALGATSTPASVTSTVLTPAPAPVAQAITFKNLMVIHRYAQRAGQSWTYTDAQIAATTKAFVKTWPTLISELTNGNVIMDNSVVVTDTPITGWDDDRPRPDGIGNWQQHVGATGNYDVMYLANPAPQTAMWAAGGVCCDQTLKVGWVFVGLRQDLGVYDDALAGWTHEWLHAVGEGLYKARIALPNVPDVHGGESFGYKRDDGGYRHWQKWYGDYLNGNIVQNGVRWGLGQQAWSKGTLRDYLIKNP